MKPTNITKTVFAAFISILIFVFLAGCGSSTTPVPELSIIQLPDGSRIVLMGNSEISFSGIAGLGTGLAENQAWLIHGEALIVSQQPAGTWFTILNPGGFIVHVAANLGTPGATMLVNYDPATGQFAVDCISGICELGPDAGHLVIVPPNEQGSLDQNGVFQGPFASDPSISGTYGNYYQSGAPIPTYVLTPTSDQAATATAACQQFNSQFPGTPCPPVLSPEQAATATAVCQQFNSQFPSTPCP